jgi:hypothetical protein
MTSVCLEPAKDVAHSFRSADPTADPHVSLELVTGLRTGRDADRDEQHSRSDLDRLTNDQPNEVLDGELVTELELFSGHEELRRTDLDRLDRHGCTRTGG